MLRCLLLFMLASGGHASVVYDLTTKSGDPSGTITRGYAINVGKVRIGGAAAKRAYLFDASTLYVIDNDAHVVHTVKHATLLDLAAHYADAVKQQQTAAADAPSELRAEAERKANDLKLASDRMRQTVLRDFHVTVRFESIDGRSCRIWEERENDTKRLELCIAPANSVPGGAEVLAGMKTLSRFREGSEFAFGVDFGASDWWSDIARLGGIPLLVREFKFDAQISEMAISSLHQAPAEPGLFEVPPGYQNVSGPEYAQWYIK